MNEVPKQENQPTFEYIDPREYLDKKLEDKDSSDKEISESLERLSVPLKKVNYKDDGRVEVKTEEINFYFTFCNSKKEDSEDMKVFSGEEVDRIIYDEIRTGKCKKIKEFVFQKDNYKRDIFASLPAGTKIFLHPANDQFGGVVMSYINDHKKERRCIFIVGDLTTPRSIMILLHEIGHIFDLKNLEQKGIDGRMKGGTLSETAERLRKERAASAFAFKVARPFLTNKNMRRDVINLLRNDALLHYEEQSKNQIAVDDNERHAYQGVADWGLEQEYTEDMFLFDEFWKWKETAAYKRWKDSEEIKKLNLEDYEEFDAWIDWTEKNNYDYEKDFVK